MDALTTLEQFVGVVRDETGLDVDTTTATLAFDELPGWDSVQLVTLLVALERRTGRRIDIADALQTPSLESLYRQVAR